VEPSNEDERQVKQLIDSLDGTFHVEREVTLPIEVDSERFILSGIVDLVVERDDEVRIFDFKTDRGRHGESEYRKQLSVYYHTLAEVFSDRPVTAALFYTEAGEAVEVDPLSKEVLGKLVLETKSDSV